MGYSLGGIDWEVLSWFSLGVLTGRYCHEILPGGIDWELLS